MGRLPGRLVELIPPLALDDRTRSPRADARHPAHGDENRRYVRRAERTLSRAAVDTRPSGHLLDLSFGQDWLAFTRLDLPIPSGLAAFEVGPMPIALLAG
jgi:hypothetical protein